MTEPWIFHEAGEAPCGCSFAMSVYHCASEFPAGDPAASRPWVGTERLTVTRCADHGGRRADLVGGRSVGDPDPTPNDTVDVCPSRQPGVYRYLCTWPVGHAGDHVAGTGDEIAAVWP